MVNKKIYVAQGDDESDAGQPFMVDETEKVSDVINRAVTKFGFQPDYARWGLTKVGNALGIGAKTCEKGHYIKEYWDGDTPSFVLVDAVRSICIC